MNHKLWSAVAARVLAMTFVIAGVTACGERVSNDVSSNAATPATTTASTSTSANAAAAGTVSPSAQVVGTAPAGSTATEPAGTTPATPNTSDVTKREEQVGKPAEGDNHSYSTLAPNTKQKAEGKNPTDSPERAKQ